MSFIQSIAPWTFSSNGMYHNVQVLGHVPKLLIIKLSAIVGENESWSSKIHNSIFEDGTNDVRTFLTRNLDSNTVFCTMVNQV